MSSPSWNGQPTLRVQRFLWVLINTPISVAATLCRARQGPIFRAHCGSLACAASLSVSVSTMRESSPEDVGIPVQPKDVCKLRSRQSVTRPFRPQNVRANTKQFAFKHGPGAPQSVARHSAQPRFAPRKNRGANLDNHERTLDRRTREWVLITPTQVGIDVGELPALTSMADCRVPQQTTALREGMWANYRRFSRTAFHGHRVYAATTAVGTEIKSPQRIGSTAKVERSLHHRITGLAAHART